LQLQLRKCLRSRRFPLNTLQALNRRYLPRLRDERRCAASQKASVGARRAASCGVLGVDVCRLAERRRPTGPPAAPKHVRRLVRPETADWRACALQLVSGTHSQRVSVAAVLIRGDRPFVQQRALLGLLTLSVPCLLAAQGWFYFDRYCKNNSRGSIYGLFNQ